MPARPIAPPVSSVPPCIQPPPQGLAAAGCWRLVPGRALSLQPRQSSVLRIVHGRVWLTAGASLGDRILEAGDALAIESGLHVVMEPWGLPGAGDAPVLFLWDQAVTQIRPAHVQALRSDWEVGVMQPLHELGRALAGGWRAVGVAAVQVIEAAARLGAGVLGFAQGRLVFNAAQTGKRVCMKNSCSA